MIIGKELKDCVKAMNLLTFNTTANCSFRNHFSFLEIQLQEMERITGLYCREDRPYWNISVIK
jgi:hypothetical protein